MHGFVTITGELNPYLLSVFPFLKTVDNLKYVMSIKIIHTMNSYASTGHREAGFGAGLERSRKKGRKTIGLPIIIKKFDEIDDCSVSEVVRTLLFLWSINISVRRSLMKKKHTLESRGPCRKRESPTNVLTFLAITSARWSELWQCSITGFNSSL